MDELWDIQRVAEYLGVTERTVYNRVRSGELPAMKIGRLWRVRVCDLEAWLEARAGGSRSIGTFDAPTIAEAGQIPPRSRLESLLAGMVDPLERRLAFVAILSDAVVSLGWSAPVVVGGHAVEFYTAGGYTTADIDLAAESAPVGQVLESWGFAAEGRYWVDSSLGFVVEVPGSALLKSRLDHVTRLTFGAMSTLIIGIEDLVVDRLAACVHWGHAESCEWARRLIETAPGLDMHYLRARAAEESVTAELDVVLAEVDRS